MAAGKINLQKASGGITAITGVDGTGNTQLVLPESGTVATTAGATETSTGLVELATTAEAQAGTDDSRAITPLKLFNSLKGSNQSLTSSGYQKLPGGLIIQWGTNAIGAVTFPITFPTNCSGIYASVNTTVAGQSGKAHTPTVLNKTTTGFSLGYIDYSSATVTNYSWLAIGY